MSDKSRFADRAIKAEQEVARLREDFREQAQDTITWQREAARLREEMESWYRRAKEAEDDVDRAYAQRDTLLAAGKRYLYALSVANGTTGPDDRQDALEGLEVAISEVEGEK